MNESERFAHRPIAYAWRYVRRRAWPHGAILAAVFGAVACSVGCQYGLKMLVDTMSGGPSSNAIWKAFAVLIGLIAGDNLLWRVGGAIASDCFVAVTGDIRSDLYRYMIGHVPDYFANHAAGAVASRVTASANAVYSIETMFVWNVLPPMLATLVSIGFLATVSLKMAGILTVVAIIMVIVLIRAAASGRTIHLAYATRAARVDGDLVDVIANLPIVRAFNGRQREISRFDRIVDEEMGSRRKSLRYLEKIRLTHAVATAIFAAGLMAWSIALWRNGTVSQGDVVLVCSLGFTVLHGTRDLAIALVDLTQHVARLAEALATLLAPHEKVAQAEAGGLAPRGGEILFDHLQFAYPGEDQLFSDFSLRVEPGDRVGLIGPSGSGKSTLLKLLQSHYPLQGGRILIDGQDISRVTEEELAASVAIVPQEPYLFQRSILDNILYGREGATRPEAIAAARDAQCLDFIEGLAQGFDTMVGDHGAKLSGGQRQRIAIARALLKNAPIVILDEATSALDADSEAAVYQALDRLMQGRTVIAVAHKLSTLRDFDRIVMIEHGKIVEQGSVPQLAQNDGRFRRLVDQEVTRLQVVQDS